jgi:hypothetical protein
MDGERAKRNSLIEDLTAYQWNGTEIDMTGLQAPVTERFKDNMVLVFQKNGQCTITIADEILKGKWSLKDNKLHIKGDGFETQYSLSLGFGDSENQHIYMRNIKNYSVYFYTSKPKSQEYLDQQEAIKAERKRNVEERKQAWIDALELDLTTIQPGFLSLLRRCKFENFRHLEIKEKDREAFMEEFFQPIYTRGLHYANWNGSYIGDGEIFLDAYELHKLNKEMDPEERKTRAGETIKVPYKAIKEYIVPHIHIANLLGLLRSNRPPKSVDPLFEIISKSDRYDSLDNSFRLKILENPNYEFKAQLIEAWESDYLGGLVLIHLLYGQGKSPQDHAWFMARRTASGNNWFFYGGSTFQPKNNI